MKFSIVVPFYNSKSYIKECIDSVLNQSYQDYELVLIDDGSTDNGSEWIGNNYSDSRIRILRKENGGVSSARNYGLEVAKGEWISFLDADDWIEDNYLMESSRIIEENQHLDLIIYNLSIDTMGDSSNYANMRSGLVKEINPIVENVICYEYSDMQYAGAYGNCRCIGGKVYKKNTISNVKFPLGIKVCEDGIFNLQVISNSSKIYLDKRALYHYVVNTSSATHSYNDIKEKQLVKILDYFRKYADQNIYRDAFNYCKFDFYTTAIFAIPDTFKWIRLRDDLKLLKAKMQEFEIDEELLRRLNDKFMMKRKVYIKKILCEGSYMLLNLFVRTVKMKDNFKR